MGGGGRVAGCNELMRAVLGLLVGMLALPAWANGRWQVMAVSPVEIISVELTSLERGVDFVSFRVRHALSDGKIDPSSQRPVREILAKHMVDCRSGRVATLSRAVFSDNDAMINYQAVLPIKAEWQAMTLDDPLFKLVCGPL